MASRNGLINIILVCNKKIDFIQEHKYCSTSALFRIGFFFFVDILISVKYENT